MLQLHIFVDSSQSVFAAAAYWRATYANGDVQARFISSKTKCAPMRTMSIPRLELQAAVLGTRLMDTVKQEHGLYKQFVGNRVAEILESTEASQWRWIPSGENVADDATRPRKAVDLSIGSRWLSGPPFLRGPEESWPRSSEGWIPPTPDEEEMKCEFALVMVNFISLQRYYNQLLRRTAWVLRFIRRCRGLRYQRGASGRIDDATCVPYSARRPIILCHDKALAEMIVQHHHERMCHQNTEATIGAIRQKFWITNLRRLLRRVVSKCNVCKLGRARPTQTEMGPLPEDRLEANGWPFKISSDNGKNFVGADREARRFSEVFEPAQIQGELSSKGVEWIFNCPAKSAEGGA
ncbi:uncharacterized protein LOC123258286 [Drosophila ananassae]|uniref:uncharacterized protein LOC123258286 n=1 Tax=Drosophila ananassae TaxID=7217 RepID=UPI001CFFE50A|nr:uncharacterized protein LOC123258286 [Drosophila ananassae]